MSVCVAPNSHVPPLRYLRSYVHVHESVSGRDDLASEWVLEPVAEAYNTYRIKLASHFHGATAGWYFIYILCIDLYISSSS